MLHFYRSQDLLLILLTNSVAIPYPQTFVSKESKKNVAAINSGVVSSGLLAMRARVNK
jgi:hypothetical protein